MLASVLYIDVVRYASDVQLDCQAHVAARLEHDLRSAVNRKSWFKHLHLVLAGRQSLENEISFGVGSGHVDRVRLVIRHDDRRVRNGGIADIKDRARKLSGEVLPRKPQGGKWEHQAQGRNFCEQPRPS